ncbi:hypothetical protein J4526_01435 [Desulfurococcaceae archaeon MEX13E-LK6-19]|nr:hypothetical protein J4526_01435 [Desulfurococcaceae archaeon MEX13E-LK6-19]
MNKIFAVLIIAIILVCPTALAASWGKYQAYEEIGIPANELSSTGITWHPLSKPYDTSNLLIGIQPVNIVFNSTAVEKKFVIELAGADTGYHLDLAFYDTGVIDIVETTPSGATKLADTLSSGIKWQNLDFIIVSINGSTVKIEASNGTVLAIVTWNTVPTAIEQIGASGGDKAVESGTVYVAILYDPYTELTRTTTETIYAFMPLLITMIALGLVLVFFKTIMKTFQKILDKL